MPDFRYGLAKGLREPASPFRTAYFFGAALNSVSAENWNAAPVLVDESFVYDLSTIPRGREVVVGLITVTSPPDGDYSINFKWYKEGLFSPIYDYSENVSARNWAWLYAYSYIGYVDWEIDVNGAYYLMITVSGRLTFQLRFDFRVDGIPEAIPDPEPERGFMAPIIGAFNTASAMVYAVYLEVIGWPWPLWLASEPFYNLSRAFNDLAWAFSDFATWVYNVENRIGEALSWDYIRGLILGWLPGLESLIAWWGDWWAVIGSRIDAWWSPMGDLVKSWIAEAKSFLQDEINTLQAGLVSLQADIDNLAGMLPTWQEVIYWWRDWRGNFAAEFQIWWTSKAIEVAGLIDSAFIARSGLWEGWQEWRDSVSTFFLDPLGYLEDRFTDWFLGPEE